MSPEPLVLGLSYMPYAARPAVEGARAAEAAGFGAFGLPDSPILWSGLFTTLAACVSATSTISAGTHVTNPVTRHWTTTAAEFRTLEELAPGRTFAGIGSGDGAVYGIGRKPARATELEAAIEELRKAAPPGLPIQVAAGGPKMAAVAGATRSDLILGTGVERLAIDELTTAADEGREAAVERWLLLIFNLAEDETSVDRAREEIRASVVAYARHSLATRLSVAHVPPEIASELGPALQEYDFHAHARPGGSANAHLLNALSPKATAYLERRYSVIDTPERAAERLVEIAEKTGIHKFWLACNVHEPAGVMRLAGARMVPRLSVAA
ncbi:MAG: 5,10-methylenetetrahydromethanopterin reductase [Thermoleophilaceae bacterium]|nr:5,10-methylenetetrahydromethanopterin reductase [Thermoleophilaceae bacterium]